MKLFVEEAGSDDVRNLVDHAHVVAASALARVECRGAFARLQREGLLAPRERRSRVGEFDHFWRDVLAINLDDGVLEIAEGLVDRHPLRAVDAVHLASALTWADGRTTPTLFACWDGGLWDAALAEGFKVVPADRP